jgi:two-component system C4-dicarboxylate transport sensor histidine kinase DctB
LPALAVLMLATLIAAGIWWWARANALDGLAERGRTELAMASDRLTEQVARYRQLAVVLAAHQSLVALLSAENDEFVGAAENLLLRTADRSGAVEIFVLSAQGYRIASSGVRVQEADFASAGYFRRAMYGALGTAQRVGRAGESRTFLFAAPIKRQGQKPIGAVVVAVGVNALETRWRGDPSVLFFTDRHGVVFVSNRFDLVFKSRSALSPATIEKYGDADLGDFPGFGSAQVAGHDIWRTSGDRSLPLTALHLVQPLPVVGLEAEILLDTRSAMATAGLQAAVGGALALVFGAGLLILIQRRLALAERLVVEERAKADLERRVAERTKQLSDANLDLRREIRERRDAEEALRRAQQDLVQAGKLSALGQMSAGISHELNQPLMAIRSFAENAEVFLERGDVETARKNLSRISDLGRRMGRIIRNLRAFARKEGEPLTEVNLVDVVNAALELTERRMTQARILIDWSPPDPPPLVRGGEVRLQQVIVNLLTNAADAMASSAEKRITIGIDAMPTGEIALSVRDTGPGLSEPEKIFDPFYTTKAVGAAEGMGLGLSISYGIVQSFGGQITGRNHDGGGSIFTVVLARAGLSEAA